MRRFLFSSALLLFASSVLCAPQSSAPAGQSTPDAAKPVAQSPAGSDQGSAESAKKRPKKVWTNDEISRVGGEGSISVVGNTNEASAKTASKGAAKSAGAASLKEKQVANYRNRLRQLQNQLETTEKQISNLRNFNGESTGTSGGINMNRRYSISSVEDQIKTLEEKKKQIQAQISDIEDAARKDGIEPGELR
jgi:chromosome segregation ATPase